MLAAIRQFAKSKIALVLLGLLILSFAIFGIGDVFGARGGDWVVRAGSRSVSEPEFRTIFDNYRTQAQQESGQDISVDAAVERGLHLRVLDEVAAAEAFAELLRRVGLVPADRLVVAEIEKTPLFFNPVSGKFDREAYARQLAENQLTPERFEGFLRDDIAQTHFASGVIAGLRAPRVFGATAAAFEGELRDLSALLVHPGLIEAPAPPTEPQLAAFLQENADRLRRPELRALTLVRFSAADVERTVAVDPAEVQRQFEFRRESLSQPERRTLVQVPAPDAAAAASAARRLRAGEDPAAVARSMGRNAVPYADVPRTAIPDRRVAEAAFSLAAGQVGDPVQGELGWSVVKVTGVTPGSSPTLEQARPQIEAELRADAAQERLAALTERYDEAREAGATLAEAARQAGVASLSIAPVSRDGRGQDGAPAALEPALLAAAFDLPQGGESELEEIGPGQYAAVRVDRVVAPSVPRLDEIRAPLAQAWLARETNRRLQARAEALAAAARRGQPLETIARGAGAPFTRLSGVTRNAQGAQVSPQVLEQAFGVKQGELFTTENGALGMVVGRVEAIRYPAPAQLGATLSARVVATTDQLLQDIGEAVRTYARGRIGVRTSPERARAALGATEPEDAEPTR